MLVFLTGHEGMLLYFGSFGTDVSSSSLAKQNNPSQLIIIILYASVLVFLTGVVIQQSAFVEYQCLCLLSNVVGEAVAKWSLSPSARYDEMMSLLL